MKNIHVLPTDKPSRLFINPLWENQLRFVKNQLIEKKHKERFPQNIYITSDEEIKERDWFITTDTNEIHKSDWIKFHFNNGKKIILTTDQDLIKDGVQAIDDEFLERFVKNPSCEFVEVKSQMVINYSFPRSVYNKHEIIIPQEEPKQDSVFNQLEVGKEYKQEVFELGEETLEEIVKPIGDFIIANAVGTEGQDGVYYHYSEVCKLLKLQSKRMYSEEDMKKSFIQGALTDLRNTWDISKEEMAKEKFNEWLEKIKKEIE